VTLKTAHHRARIEVLLVQHRPDALCVHCIAVTLAIRDTAAQRAAAYLEGMPGYARKDMRCAKCGKQRLTVRAT
jgi:hypothetical protein